MLRYVPNLLRPARYATTYCCRHKLTPPLHLPHNFDIMFTTYEEFTRLARDQAGSNYITLYYNFHLPYVECPRDIVIVIVMIMYIYIYTYIYIYICIHKGVSLSLSISLSLYLSLYLSIYIYIYLYLYLSLYIYLSLSIYIHIDIYHTDCEARPLAVRCPRRIILCYVMYMLCMLCYVYLQGLGVMYMFRVYGFRVCYLMLCIY